MLATQNPIELEGTYPLPEAQLDRFMFNIFVDYPSHDEEVEIVETTTSAYAPDLEVVLTATDIIGLQKLVRRVPVPRHVVEYAVRLARATRPGKERCAGVYNRLGQLGRRPQGETVPDPGGQDRAPFSGGATLPPAKTCAVCAKPVLRHRIITNFNAEAEGVNTIDIIKRLLEEIPEVKGD